MPIEFFRFAISRKIQNPAEEEPPAVRPLELAVLTRTSKPAAKGSDNGSNCPVWTC
jgi:hypothetical protein